MKILDIPQSGSLAGVTSSRNRFGQYRRTRATPVNPNTSFQTASRARLATLTTQWRGLTAAQRDGWDSIAQQLPRTDSLGQTIHLTGAQAYIGANSIRLQAGQTRLDDPPGLPEFPALEIGTLTLAVDAGAVAAFTAGFTPTPPGADFRVLGYASPPRSAGRSFEHDYRLLILGALNAAGPLNLAAAFEARFGAPPVGGRVFVRLRVAHVSGLLGPAVSGSVLAETI